MSVESKLFDDDDDDDVNDVITCMSTYFLTL